MASHFHWHEGRAHEHEHERIHHGEAFGHEHDMAEVVTVRYESRSQPGRLYVTRVLGDKAVCSCPGFSSHEHCWHTDQAIKGQVAVERKVIPMEGPMLERLRASVRKIQERKA